MTSKPGALRNKQDINSICYILKMCNFFLWVDAAIWKRRLVLSAYIGTACSSDRLLFVIACLVCSCRSKWYFQCYHAVQTCRPALSISAGATTPLPPFCTEKKTKQTKKNFMSRPRVCACLPFILGICYFVDLKEGGCCFILFLVCHFSCSRRYQVYCVLCVVD